MFDSSVFYRERIQKTILIALFFLLTVALMITWNMPAEGFESSIYRSTPLVFWAGVISSFIGGTFFIIHSRPGGTPDSPWLRNSGMLLVILAYTAIVGLFIIRGYFMWCIGGDPASHIGSINEILGAHYLPRLLIYPITHIYLSETILVTGLDLVVLHKIVPLVFALLCVGFMYILVRALSSDLLTPRLAAVISCAMVFGWYLNFTPNALSNLFFPLVLFLMFRFLQKNSISWAILLLAAIILYPEFHPIPAIFLGMVFLSLWVPALLPGIWLLIREGRESFRGAVVPYFKVLIPLVILMIWFIFWISSFPAWDYSVKGLYQVIIAEGGISRASDALNLVSYAQGYGYDVTGQILKRLGGPLILGILALLAFPLILKESLKNRAERDLFSLYGPFVLVSVLIPLLYLYNPVFDPIRLVIYAAMLGAAFTAYLLAYLLRSAEKGKNRIGQRIVSLFALAILAVLFLLGFLNIYPSPYNLTPSYHTTQSEVIGMNYFYAHRDVNISVMCITAAPGRFAEAFLTPTERRVQRLPQYMLPDKGLAPWHFGYDSSFSLSDSYAGKTNLLTVQRDTVIYTDYLPDMARFRFTPRDFERLDDDPGVNDLYSNGGFEIREISKPPVMVIS